jgi:hypothetical protein
MINTGLQEDALLNEEMKKIKEQVSGQIGPRLSDLFSFMGSDTGKSPAPSGRFKEHLYEIGESVPVYTIKRDSLRSRKGAFQSLDALIEPLGRWHHQIRFADDHRVIGYARSKEEGDSQIVTQVALSSPTQEDKPTSPPLAESLDDAIDILDKHLETRGQGEPQVKLIEVLPLRLRALYVKDDAEQVSEYIVVISSLPWSVQKQYGIQARHVYHHDEFLRLLERMAADASREFPPETNIPKNKGHIATARRNVMAPDKSDKEQSPAETVEADYEAEV